MRFNQPTLRTFLVFALFLWLTFFAFGTTVPRFAFIANTNDNTLSVYTVNATSGLLRDDGYAVVGSKPAGATLTPSGALLYVANSGSHNLSAFEVNLSNSILTAVSGSPFAAQTEPAAVVTDPAGKFLYVANKGSGDISAYTIDAGTGR
jgi:6-phosphogluconolactonase